MRIVTGRYRNKDHDRDIMALKRRYRAVQVSMLAALSLLVLAGCGNAYESLSMGEWIDVGASEPPVPRFRGELSITKLAQGDPTKVVRPSDLVQIRADITKASKYHNNRVQQSATFWLWTGREPPATNYDDIVSWGDIGSGHLRKELLGRHLHERFRVQLAAGAEGSLRAPMNGFIAVPDTTILYYGERIGHFKWPALLVSRSVDSDEPTWADIEVRRICPGRLLRRTATMRQFGAVLNIMDMDYKLFRQGLLTWSALEGECESPKEKIRLEVGPIYNFRNSESTKLYNWSDSYQNIRPPARFPHEYISVNDTKRYPVQN